MDETSFYFGDWQIDPKSNRVRSGDTVKQLEPKAMDVLKLLCHHQGDVLSSDEIVSHCWPDFDVGDNPLHKVINQLRRALGDSASSPIYIETIRKRGYRTVAPVKYLVGDQQGAQTNVWQKGSPFPGLQAFDAEHADVFFGRKAQVDTLLDRIANQVHFGRSFCLVLGPSGSGKSSLVQAGVIPNLMTEQGYNGIKVNSYTSLDLADVGVHQLFLELASVLLDWEIKGTAVFYGESAQELAQKLVERPQEIVKHCKRVLQEQADHLSMLALFIDRLEVLLSSPLYSEAVRLQFVELIERFVTSGVILVISACRNDFYPQLVAYQPLMAGKAKGAHFDLSPPNRAELLQMIRLPAQAAQLEWQVDPVTGISLDEQLCDDAAMSQDCLPMLQYTLQALYLNRDDRGHLLVSVYQELGGIEGAIGKNAEQAIAALSDAEKECLPQVLSQLVTMQHDDASITSRSGRWSLLSSEAEKALVQAMVDSRLFVSHLQNEAACFSIAHEALLRRWPRATEWIADHQESLAAKSRLHYLAKRWQDEHKSPAYLLPAGKPLQEAQALVASNLFSVNADESEFIRASSQRQNVKTWTLRGTVLLLIMLTITSVSMTVKSIDAENRALEKRLAAENLLGFMVGEFADKLRGIGRMDLLDGISNKALEYFSEQSNTSDTSLYSFDARFQHGQTLEAMGEVAYSRGKIDEATAALLSAKSKLEALLTEQPQNLELLKTLGANAFWLGQIQYDASDWQATQPFFELYYQYSQQMYQIAPNDADALMELSYATNSLGSLLMKRQEFKQAKDFFEESLQLKITALAADQGNPVLIADLIDTRSWLADSELSAGNLAQSIEYLEITKSEYLSMDDSIFENANLLENIAMSLHDLSIQYMYIGRTKDAVNTGLQSYHLFKAVVNKDNKNRFWQQRLFVVTLHLIKIDPNMVYQRTLRVEELLNTLKRAAGLMEDSRREMHLKLLLNNLLALNYLRDGRIQKSEQYLAKSRQFVDALLELNAESMEYKRLSSVIDLISAEKSAHEKDVVEMIELCTSASKKLYDLQLLNQNPKYVIPYADSVRCKDRLSSTDDLSSLVKGQNLVSEYFITEEVRNGR
ncbi:winged helix-turn-helix domain-containing protein [Shewanella waksmanii]|uniref:nSTAND1 domain-containing NTPase n=1 Tax=Shewanella waksmanii TaxID=213783 RepID=UPI003734DFC7